MKRSKLSRVAWVAVAAISAGSVTGLKTTFAEEADWDAITQEMAELPQDLSEAPENIQPNIEGSIASDEPEDDLPPGANSSRIHDQISVLPEPVRSAVRNSTAAKAPQASHRMQVTVFKAPRGLNVDREFGVVEIDGKLKNVFAVSTAIAGKYTVEGTFQLRVGTMRGRVYPWIRSLSYSGSPMYWGLEITRDSIYWIHSTPHYGPLGKPASMGCVRVNHPTAMELWDQATNHVKGSSVITIHASGSSAALGAYREIKSRYGLTDARVREMIQTDIDDAHAVTRGDYHGNGHWRRVPDRVFPHMKSGQYPSCRGASCFSLWGVRPRVK